MCSTLHKNKHQKPTGGSVPNLRIPSTFHTQPYRIFIFNLQQTTSCPRRNSVALSATQVTSMSTLKVKVSIPTSGFKSISPGTEGHWRALRIVRSGDAFFYFFHGGCRHTPAVRSSQYTNELSATTGSCCPFFYRLFINSPWDQFNSVGDIPTPLKNHGVKVSWDDDMTPIWWESRKVIIQSMVRVTTNQPSFGLPGSLQTLFWGVECGVWERLTRTSKSRMIKLIKFLL